MAENESTTEQIPTNFRVQSQIDRLSKFLSFMKDLEMENRINFGNSPVFQDIEAIHMMKEEQWTIIEKFEVKDSVNEFDNILDNYQKDVRYKQLLHEREMLTNELKELKSSLYDIEQKQNELLLNLQKATIEQSVLEHLLKYSIQENNN